MKSKKVRDALVSLDGKSFDSKEDVENAVYPLFSSLTTIFHGEGHRDLVDRLIAARWLEVVNGKWNLSLPPEDKFQTVSVHRDIDVAKEELSANSVLNNPRFEDDKRNQQANPKTKDDAISAILRHDYKEAIHILTTLL